MEKVDEKCKLSLKDIEEAKALIDRYDKILLMSSEFIPDDVLGLLTVRPCDFERLESVFKNG